ncbi:hypothetical protein ACU4GR_01310 [Methylobacterium oryzae CBMB20]
MRTPSEVELERACYIDAEIGHPRFPGCFNSDKGLKALEGALAIRRQADALGLEEAASRLDAARGPNKPVKKRSSSLPAKVKEWLGLPQAPENAD